MLAYGKSYRVSQNTGTTNIYRDGKLVGTVPEAGYRVEMFGMGTLLAGTELAAHALAEVYKDVVPWNRRWVLSEAEYEEHVTVLRGHIAAIMEAYPYSAEEAAAVQASNEKYAKIIEQGREGLKKKLMGLSPYENIRWGRQPPSRPTSFPTDETVEQTPGMRM